MMDWESLRHFLAIARIGTLSGAARALRRQMAEGAGTHRRLDFRGADDHCRGGARA